MSTSYRISRKEIKGLIQIIKQEKEQISEDLQSMSKELSKYKVAYKHLVELAIRAFVISFVEEAARAAS